MWIQTFSIQLSGALNYQESVYAYTLATFEGEEGGESSGTFVPCGRYRFSVILVVYIPIPVFDLEVPWSTICGGSAVANQGHAGC